MKNACPHAALAAHGVALTVILAACAADATPKESDLEELGSDAAEFSDPSEATDNPVDFSGYVVLPSSAVRPLNLRWVRSVDLAQDARNVPSRVSSVALHGGRVYVLDAPARRIRSYDHAGRSLSAVGQWGHRDGEMSDPIDLAFEGDTLLLLDVTHYTSISAFDLSGNYVGLRIPEFYDGGTTAFGSLGDTVYVATLPGDTSARNPYVVRALNRQGKIIARGCWRDPEYASSARHNGELQAYGFSSVAVAAGRIYCTQPITPIVQVLNSSGRLLDAIKIAPPFYVAPHDIPETMNDRAMRAFESTFTAHLGIFARRRGFVSVYYRYDSAQSRDEYRLFACARAPKKYRCAAAVSPGAPLRLIEPDTLIVAETPTGAAGPRLSFYVIR